MRAECVTDTNFQGKLVIQNKFSKVAESKMEKAKVSIEELIASKNYDLYVQQDYGYNIVNFIASHNFPTKMADIYKKISIPIVSKYSKYTEAAKNAIEEYENAILNEKQKCWENEKKHRVVQDFKDTVGTILYFPLFMINDILYEINPKWSKKFERFIDRI